MIEILRRVPKDKKLVVAGCLPLINWERLSKEVRFDGVVGPAWGGRIVEIVDRVSRGEKMVALDDAECALPSLSLPRERLSPVISIIPISYGCLGSCAYCCVTFARGHLRSYGIEEIVQRAKSDVGSGMLELWITSQDTACYGRDRGTNLAGLLRALCKLQGDFKIRVGMMTPDHVRDILGELVETYQDGHVFKFVHLPVQSGDDEVLRRMRRFYSVEDFMRIVEAFRARFPEITLSTDVICGFPGESVEASERTLRLIEAVKPDVVNVSKFAARPRTVAAEMTEDFVPAGEIRRRSRLMASLARRVALERNKRWVGWRGVVVVDEVGKVAGSLVGRNYAYKPIAIRSREKLLDRTVQAKVVRAFSTHLEGEIAMQNC
jgi:MiaB-like tRNA modifying enzyme